MKILFDMASIFPAPNGVVAHGGAEYTKTVFDYCIRRIDFEKNEVWLYVPYYDERAERFIDCYKDFPIQFYQPTNPSEMQVFLNKEKFNVIYSGLVVGNFLTLKLPPETKYILTEHGLRGIETRFDTHFVRTERKKFKNIIKMLMSVFCKRFYEKAKVKKYSKQFLFHNNIEVFTVSNHSKFAIEYYYPYLFGKTHVGYSPMKLNYGSLDEDILNRNGLEKKKFILLISANRGEKNCLRGVEAINLLLRKNLLPDGYKIVLAGVNYKKPFTKLTKQYTDRYCLLQYLETAELEALYCNAHLFLYPTVNEGFGYPPLEAMKYGTPVATSAVCSIPEVCGDCVLYFNPYDIHEIANRIMQSFDEQIVTAKKRLMAERLAYIGKRQEEGLALLYKHIMDESA